MPEKLSTNKRGFIKTLFEGAIVSHFRKVNESKEWHLLSKWRGVLNLLAFRIELRERNLHDTDGDLTKPKGECPFHPNPPAAAMRTASGTQNDLHYPAMGCRGSRLGRNVPPSLTAPDLARLMTPNPLIVSQRLLARKEFKPATSLNLLVGAWIQFQVHDWFGHEKESLGSDEQLQVPTAGDRDEPGDMTLPKTKPDPEVLTSQDDKYPAYRNADPQWWDGSQIYGETEEETAKLRTDPTTGTQCSSGHLYVDKNGLSAVGPRDWRDR